MDQPMPHADAVEFVGPADQAQLKADKHVVSSASASNLLLTTACMISSDL
jgi:hypothetical protein